MLNAIYSIARLISPDSFNRESLPSAVLPDIVYRESLPIAVIPDICYRESILGLFRWIPADYLRG